MSEQERQDSAEEQRPDAGCDRQPWSPPTLTDLGAVGEITQGISYNPGDGIYNLTPS